MAQKVIIIGAGIAGLSSACYLAKAGYDVTVVEKNEHPGGRANFFEAEGYRFDMGPSWYLMPDIFEDFFRLMDERIEDHLTLEKLSPSYRIFFKEQVETKQPAQVIDVYSEQEKYETLFEQIEPGSVAKLRTYLSESKIKYTVSKEEFLYKNYDSVIDFFTWQTLTQGFRLNIFSKMHTYVASFFQSPILQKILEYQLVFLGSSPYNTPALYSLMSHIDFEMGVFYPREGIMGIPRAFEKIAQKNGATFRYQTPVNKIIIDNGKVTGVELNDGTILAADIVVSNADIHHTETALLEETHRTYDKDYWKDKTMAPSAFILYLGVKGKIDSLTHHNLIFSEDWRENFRQIFDDPMLPTDPSLYVCCPTKSDPMLAPENCENLFVLVPIPAGIDPSAEELEDYRQKIIQTLSSEMSIPDLESRIEYSRLFCLDDFKSLYNSYQGTALGLAHTLTQTALFRPNNYSKKVAGLYYAGAGTNPGIGMPICLISGEIVYKRIKGIKSGAPLKSL